MNYSTCTCNSINYYQANNGEISIIEQGDSLVVAKGTSFQTETETAWSPISQEEFEAKLHEATESIHVTASRLATRNARIQDNQAPTGNGFE